MRTEGRCDGEEDGAAPFAEPELSLHTSRIKHFLPTDSADEPSFLQLVEVGDGLFYVLGVVVGVTPRS